VIHPEIQRHIAAAHIEDLQRAARRRPELLERPFRRIWFGGRLRRWGWSRSRVIVVNPKAQERA
jgi:hypothetical protein